MNKTSIEWTDYTWNPVTGCNKVSQGCKNCYAETNAKRFWGDRKFTDVIIHEDRLHEPQKNAKKWAGKKVFVCSMSDLFHESVSFEFIDRVFAQFVNFPDTTFQLLTKRPDRALEYYKHAESEYSRIPHYACEGSSGFTYLRYEWPLENVWIGTSCEDQETAEQRIPLLLHIPAAVRFLSCEPLLGPIDLQLFDHSCENRYNPNYGIHWVIAGGESGHGARPMHPHWVRSLRDQCKAADVPFFFKQWGNYLPWGQEDANGWIEVKLNGYSSEGPPSRWCRKMKKSLSGNLLDGVSHLEFPTTK